MNKVAFDLYHCQSKITTDLDGMYNACVELGRSLNLELIFRPTIVPYFYGKERMDDGISCFCLMKETSGAGIGLFTLHSFSQRNIVYFDIVSNTQLDANKILTYLVHLFNPGEVKTPTDEIGENLFGVQLQLECETKNLSLDQQYDIQNEIIRTIDMTQIHNVVVQKTHSSVCMITLIAESHIAIVYDKERHMLYLDVFSCKNFDPQKVVAIITALQSVNIVSSKINGRGDRHFDSIKYGLSQEEILKIKSYLLCYGLAIDDKARDFISLNKPYVKDKGFVHAFNLSVFGRNTCVSTAEMFSSDSQFFLNYNPYNHQYFIHNNQYKYIPVNVFDDLPKTDTIIDKIAKPHSLTCVSLWPSLKCCFAERADLKCKFCSIENTEYDIIPAQEVVSGIEKLFERTYQYSLNIGGGTYRSPDFMADYLIEIIEGVRKFSDTAISCEIAPPKDLNKIDAMQKAGCNSLIINLEVANDMLRADVCPAKHTIPYERYYETYRYAVEVFGKGKVSCVLIVGIQPDEDIIRECRKLVRIGVIPTLIPFKAMDNCFYHDRENCNPESLILCAKTLAEELAKEGLSPCNQLGCTKCGGCSLEVDYARMLQNF